MRAHTIQRVLGACVLAWGASETSAQSSGASGADPAGQATPPSPAAPATAAEASAAKPAPLPAGIAAAAGETQVTIAELDRVLVDRFGLSETGREVLKHLISMRFLEQLGIERRVQITSADLDRRYAELDEKIRESGNKEGLAGEIEANRLDRAFFLRTLRLAMIQERLTREALAISADARVTGEQQEIWLDQELEARGYLVHEPPWTSAVAHCGDLEVTRAEFAEYLRRELPVGDIGEACYQLLLDKLLGARLREILGHEPASAEWSAAIEREIARRRAEVEGDVRYRGLSYEQVIEAQGIRMAWLPEDPAVRVATLATLCVDHAHGEDGVRRTYEAEREAFEARHGEALRARLIFLRGAATKGPLGLRTLAEATAELDKIGSEVRSEADFTARAQQVNDDADLKRAGGELDWMTRADPRVPEAIRAAVFASADAEPLPPGGRLLGPMTLSSGAALAWLAERRPSPDWSVMSASVHRELRRRLIEELLPRASVRTYLDRS